MLLEGRWLGGQILRQEGFPQVLRGPQEWTGCATPHARRSCPVGQVAIERVVLEFGRATLGTNNSTDSVRREWHVVGPSGGGR
jgi:hypothetical protein